MDSSSFQKNCEHSAEQSILLLKFNNLDTTGVQHINHCTLFLILLLLSFVRYCFYTMHDYYSHTRAHAHTDTYTMHTTHTRTHIHTHTHKRHTQYHMYMYPSKQKTYNACVICNHLITTLVTKNAATCPSFHEQHIMLMQFSYFLIINNY